jgi:hypothetical protein
MASGEMSEDEFTDFLSAVMRASKRYTHPGSIHFYCMDWRHLGELLDAGRSAGLRHLQLCVWAKETAGMGSLYRSQHELIFVFKHGRERHRNNVELGRFGRNRTNLWSYPGAIGLRSSDEGNLVALHPTVKPVAMVADAIMDVPARGDIVLDPFLGSGTTVIAAERTGCIIIIMQRLHEDDLVGHVLEREEWEVLSFPAIAEQDEDYQIDSIYGRRRFTRRTGEALHHEREPLDVLARICATIGEYSFAGQYQQAPRRWTVAS